MNFDSEDPSGRELVAEGEGIFNKTRATDPLLAEDAFLVFVNKR